MKRKEKQMYVCMYVCISLPSLPVCLQPKQQRRNTPDVASVLLHAGEHA